MLISPFEAPRTRQYDAQYYVILPEHQDKGLTEHYSSLPRVNFSEYRSDSAMMNKSAIARFLRAGGYID